MIFICLVDQWKKRGSSDIYDLLRLKISRTAFCEDSDLMRMDVMVIYLIEQ